MRGQRAGIELRGGKEQAGCGESGPRGGKALGCRVPRAGLGREVAAGPGEKGSGPWFAGLSGKGGSCSLG